MAGRPWTSYEVAATVEDYFSMLDDEVHGRDYHKGHHREDLAKKLEDRSDSAIEYKHRNISAVLRELGLKRISGYKPLHNYQASLSEAVDHELRRRGQRFVRLLVEDAELR